MHERIAELETLAGSARDVRQRLQDTQHSLLDQPTREFQNSNWMVFYLLASYLIIIY